MFPVFPCMLLPPPFPVLGLDSRGVGGLMNSFPPPEGHAQNPLQVGTAAAVVTAPPAPAAASSVDTGALKQPPAPPPPPHAVSAPAAEAAPPAAAATITAAAATAVAAPTSTVAVAPVASVLEKKTKSKGPYICALCAKEFKNGYNLRRREAIHTGAKAGRVPSGAMKMPTMVPLSLLSVPQLSGASGGRGEAGAGGGTAAVAPGGVVTTTTSGKRIRIRKNHACEMCGKAFRDVYHLNRHKLSHSDEKPYQCPVCQQRFKRKDRMSYHVRSHDGAVHKPYNCSHCGKSFSQPDHLNSHVRQVHSTERPFKCEKCEAAFATKDRLRAHTVRHEEKVPCHVCGKMLSSAYISDHMKVHSQGPHHVCELCNKGTGEVGPMAAAAAAAAAAAMAGPPPTAVGSLSGAEGVPVSSQPLPSQPW
ncbi:LOW QUALITY PROTEIN: myc-associated zinc finger protein-like [Mesocricetus auratus]|uniref:LOW QUALITY PROTEIN: myc-associated zinc finger protein-like n=1 Tax=Mesocricetus auratus TaxID=10036 RepID=A0ABM2XMR6_MESAU|nr:LOW QUALITY PROTEIN: myc-associated zinc finger protein-like [Mesocricetus auratus]